MGRTRNVSGYLTAATAVGACVIGIAGCGGGGDDGTTSAGATAAPTASITQSTPDPGKFRPDEGPTATAPAAPDNRSAGAAEAQRIMKPFRDCLSSHGVDLPPLNGSGAFREQLQDPRRYRAAIRASIDCIPELPPRLRQAAERWKRRYEQRQG